MEVLRLPNYVKLIKSTSRTCEFDPGPSVTKVADLTPEELTEPSFSLTS